MNIYMFECEVSFVDLGCHSFFTTESGYTPSLYMFTRSHFMVIIVVSILLKKKRKKKEVEEISFCDVCEGMLRYDLNK
jgi:hypothetical protein